MNLYPNNVTKSDILGVGLEPKIQQKSKNTSLQAAFKNNLKKVDRHLAIQPLETLETTVWPTRNHRFHLSSFAAKCLEK